MPKVSFFKTVARFFTGIREAPGAMLKRRAERHQMLQGRLKDCDAFLLSIQPIVNATTPESKKSLQKELDAIENDFDYVCKHFHTSTPELDRRLEIIIVKSRTLKIYAACLAALNSAQYESSRNFIQDILDSLTNLRQIRMYHEDVTSAELIEYKQELKNLETKTMTHIDVNNLIQ